MNSSRTPRTTARLLTWYDKHRRDLPWRETRDPYRIWVAEVMLQQTQVNTVIPYYTRFLTQFPTVQALAQASLDEVLKRWEGLGYYSRARHLHAAASIVTEQFQGQIPDTREELLKLPGIGPYTAGAVLSIAYDQDVPVLDGNVRRILSRLFAIDQDVTRGEGQRRVRDLAISLLPSGRAGDFNQALMDLGSAICTPRAPRCGGCPLVRECRAHQMGQEESFPLRRPRVPRPHYEVTAGIVWNEAGRFLIAQRPIYDLLGGLWEFPGGKREAEETLEECLRRELVEELGIEVVVDSLLTIVRHAYTHFRITLHAFHCRLTSGSPQALECADWAWITLDDVDRYAFSKADHKIIAALRDPAASV